MKKYVASDFHLGGDQCNIPKINEFLSLAASDANELILIGDIFDTWVCEYEDIIKDEQNKAVLDTILSLAERIPVIYITGNHDSGINTKIESDKIKFMDWLFIDNCLFIHGHQYDLQQEIASPLYSLIEKFFPSIYRYFFKTPAQLIDYPIEYGDRCKEFHDTLREVINKRKLTYLFCGHSHDPLIDSCGLVDCGDFVYHCSYVVIDDGIANLIDL